MVSPQLTILCYNHVKIGGMIGVTDMKTTAELEQEIRNTTNILDYLKHNRTEMQLDSLPNYLSDWLTQKALTKADVVRGSNLTKAYVYQIFQGRKFPSRDKVIALAFGLRMNAEETQTLLKQAGYRELYPRDPRDALLLYSIEKQKDIIQTNELLYDQGTEVLE